MNRKEQIKTIKPLGIRLLKPILILVLIIGCCYLSIVYFPGWFWETTLCGNSNVETILSPNGKYKVVTFLRDCGATTAWTPQVSLLKAGDKLPNRDGNIFIGSYQETFIEAEWITDTRLVIRYTVHEKLPSLEIDHKYNILIEYREVQPTE